MLTINQIIVVEGKYDKIKLSSFINATIITTDGFKIYNDRGKINMIKALANKYGVIIITDSDVAGFKIRHFISGFISQDKITHIYIPQIFGKEKRKTKLSKEKMLGVEGIDKAIFMKILSQAGIPSDKDQELKNNKKITILDFYQDGLIGVNNSKYKRQIIKDKLKLPCYLSTKSLLEVLNRILTYDEYKKFIHLLDD